MFFCLSLQLLLVCLVASWTLGLRPYGEGVAHVSGIRFEWFYDNGQKMTGSTNMFPILGGAGGGGGAQSQQPQPGMWPTLALPETQVYPERKRLHHIYRACYVPERAPGGAALITHSLRLENRFVQCPSSAGRWTTRSVAGRPRQNLRRSELVGEPSRDSSRVALSNTRSEGFYAIRIARESRSKVMCRVSHLSAPFLASTFASARFWSFSRRQFPTDSINP